MFAVQVSFIWFSIPKILATEACVARKLHHFAWSGYPGFFMEFFLEVGM
jgi:hypothetical protein